MKEIIVKIVLLDNHTNDDVEGIVSDIKITKAVWEVEVFQR